MAIPEVPTDPRKAAVFLARERLVDLKLGVAIASGIAMVALTGAAAYSTNIAVAASAQNGTLAPGGQDNSASATGAGSGSSQDDSGYPAPAPATNTGPAAPSRRSGGSTAPSGAAPKIVTAQS